MTSETASETAAPTDLHPEKHETAAQPLPPAPCFFPLCAMQQALDYWVDACQRQVLFADVLRQRSNAHFEREHETEPSVLHFGHEVVLDGRHLQHPVNYQLLRILPPEGVVLDPTKRPFIVFDPRSGNGPGIGGMKEDSEIGSTLRAGYPCYFVGFSPTPDPAQTIEHINEAEAIFIAKVIEMHPGAEKPCLIGNCQAGWQIAMVSAIYPELPGVLIMAGAPMSFWAGVRGEDTVRYLSGLMGGAWTASLASDLGDGMFDGAGLIGGFEALNPALTYWEKVRNLYAKIDTEAQRFLEFERWWDSPVLLTGEEIKFIADDLFVGNRLSIGQVSTTEGLCVDLRNIKAPIICFASHADEITPPQQALGWILDLYRHDEEIVATGQTIIYCLHETIGHLGIFVSTSVASKEHDKFVQNIDLIESLPPGLYEAVFLDKTEKTANADLASGSHVLRFEPRTLAHLRAMGGNDTEDDLRFAAAARVSDNIKGVYETYLSPWIKLASNEMTAAALRAAHPVRVRYGLFSDRNPYLSGLGATASYVRENRRAVPPDNFFWQFQETLARNVATAWACYREACDGWVEQAFLSLYGSPFLQASVGLRNARPYSKKTAHRDVDRERSVQQRIHALTNMASVGGLHEATMRALFYVLRAGYGLDERGFRMLRKLFRQSKTLNMPLAEIKALMKSQTALLMLDETLAMETIPVLLDNATAEGEAEALSIVHKIVEARGEVPAEVTKRLHKLEKYFAAAHTSFHRRASDVQVFGQPPEGKK